MNLFEAYRGRLSVAEKNYALRHNGEKMDTNKKLVVASCLRNIDKFMNEAFNNSVGTQRADLGLFKKFALNLTNVAVPNLIASDLVITYPMSSMTGYINYLQYTAGSNKGQTKQGDVFNDPFRLGKVDPDYTGAAVVDTVPARTTELTPAWTPVVKGAFTGDDGSTKYDVKIVKAAGGVSYANLTGEGKVTGLAEGDRVAYFYDNVVIPQNDLPTVNVEMKSMTLLAKARRVAVYYSQIAAFQAKTDYGFDLGDQLAEKAVGQLQYEIDTEVTNLLIETAGEPVGDLVWSKTLPVGVSKRDHYEGFAEVIGIGKKMIYDRTRRFAPNYMIASSDILPILGFISGFTAAPASNINGPYFAGTLDGIKVYITPNIESGVFALGVNGDDFMSSVAVYAPYMPIVPTQLLGFADGGMSQGWSTMYDLKVLNKDLIVAGKIVA